MVCILGGGEHICRTMFGMTCDSEAISRQPFSSSILPKREQM